MTIEITGSISGSAREHTEESLKLSWKKALLVLPGENGPVETTPSEVSTASKYPALLFAHGSSGIAPAVREFGRFIASCGFAFVCPDSIQLADRITYSSPVSRSDYECIHAMRTTELLYAARKLAEAPWFNGTYTVAGTSEGGVAAARFDSSDLAVKEAGKIIFSWSCEENYFVQTPGNVFADNVPVLQVMSLEDKFFSPANTYLDNDKAFGYARKELESKENAAVVLIPKAPHTLLNLQQTQAAVKGFLSGL